MVFGVVKTINDAVLDTESTFHLNVLSLDYEYEKHVVLNIVCVVHFTAP